MRRSALGGRDARDRGPRPRAAVPTAPTARRRLAAVLAVAVPLLGCLGVASARDPGRRVPPEPPRVAPEPAAVSIHVHRVSTVALADDPKKTDDPKKPSGPCGEASVECRDALEKLRLDALSSIDLDIRVGGRAGNDYPCECRLEGAVYEPRRFASTIFTWKAAGYCHKPLYFEHWALERYGHSRGFVADSFCSAAHFFVTLPVLPYKMGVELPWECVYPLGYYRPGNCAPWTVPAVPISGRGLAVQAATVTGLVFLLP